MVWRSRRVVKYVDAVSNCRFLHCLLSSVSERFTCQLNVMCSPDFSDHDLNGRALDEDASLDLSLFPGLGRGPEDQCVRHEHRFGSQPDWR